MTSTRFQPYAELCVTSNFTFLHGASHPEELVTRATELGLTAYNVTEGFEGDPDQHAHCYPICDAHRDADAHTDAQPLPGLYGGGTA